MKAITVKYMGPTNNRGSRLKVSDNDGHSMVVPYDHGMNDEERVARAALAFLAKMDWKGRWVMGSIAGPKGCDVLVCDPILGCKDVTRVAGFQDYE